MNDIYGWPPHLENPLNQLKRKIKNSSEEPFPNILSPEIKRRIQYLKDVVLVPRDIPEYEYFDAFDFPGYGVFNFNSYNILPQDNGIFEDLCRCPSLIRLSGIKQLSYLQDFEHEKYRLKDLVLCPELIYHHTREGHSVLVALIMSTILQKLEVSKYEYINGVIAGLLHDIATPSGGEATISALPDMGEEENFLFVFDHFEDIKKWKEKYPDFDLMFIQSIIKNEGLVGKILDICDKAAYVSLDCFFHGIPCINSPVRKYLVKYPLITDVVWDMELTHDKKDIYFANIERLASFLWIRTLEFDRILKDPRNRVVEIYMRNLIRKTFDKGYITKEELLTYNDEILKMRLANVYGSEELYFPIRLSNSNYYILTEKETTEEVTDKLRKSDHEIIGCEDVKRFNPNIDLLVENGEKIVPFCKVEPALAKMLNKKADYTNRTIIYYRLKTEDH